MPAIPPLWDGYDDKSEDDLLDLLERKVEAALDDGDPTVDERLTRDFAQALSSHEWLKRNVAGEHHERLYARAREIAGQDVGSWRPK